MDSQTGALSKCPSCNRERPYSQDIIRCDGCHSMICLGCVEQGPAAMPILCKVCKESMHATDSADGSAPSNGRKG